MSYFSRVYNLQKQNIPYWINIKPPKPSYGTHQWHVGTVCFSVFKTFAYFIITVQYTDSTYIYAHPMVDYLYTC